jgi:hypothetical protein
LTNETRNVVDILVDEGLIDEEKFNEVLANVSTTVTELEVDDIGTGIGPFLRSIEQKIEETHYENLMSQGAVGFTNLTLALAIILQVAYDKGYRIGHAEETITVGEPTVDGSESIEGDEQILPF